MIGLGVRRVYIFQSWITHACAYKMICKKLRSFVVASAHTNGVLFIYNLIKHLSSFTGLIILGKSPVNDIDLLGSIVDENVLGFDITMHNATAVGIVQSLNRSASCKRALQSKSCRNSNEARNPTDRHKTTTDVIQRGETVLL